ncbi:MAG: AbrB family transcriptional regulator [Silicimonas sp.]|nr:AbrB family transcriptional regulator [Silicimonas sp.]
MPASPSSAHARQAIALAIGLVGAIAANALGIPLPWMLGPMVIVLVVAVAGAPVIPPVTLRALVVPILGVMLGSGFHPGLFAHIADWALTLLILPVFVAAAFSCSALIYRKIGRYDIVTAYFSAAPGGLNDMMILGAEAGGDEKRIALAHASRVFIVVTFVAFFYASFLGISIAGEDRPYIGFADVPGADLAILAACAVLGAWLGPKIGLPAPQILGPMILSGIAHLTALTDAPPPTLAVNAAQLVMGTVIGCRFAGARPREIARDMALAAAASGLMLVIALATAFAVTSLTGIHLSETFLTFSPGGLPEMSLLALSMNADIAYVATIHIVRITLVIAVAPVVFRLVRPNRESER